MRVIFISLWLKSVSLTQNSFLRFRDTDLIVSMTLPCGHNSNPKFNLYKGKINNHIPPNLGSSPSLTLKRDTIICHRAANMIILESSLNQLVSMFYRLSLLKSRHISSSPWHTDPLPCSLYLQGELSNGYTLPLLHSSNLPSQQLMSLSKTQSWSSLNLLIALYWSENEDVLFGQLHMSLTMWPWPSVLILSLCLVSELHSNQIHLHPSDCVRLLLPSSCWSIWVDRPCCCTWRVVGYTSFQGHFLDEAPADMPLPRVCAPALTLKNAFLIALTLVFHMLGYISSQAEGQSCALFLEGHWCSAQGGYAAGPSLRACWMNRGKGQKEMVKGI